GFIHDGLAYEIRQRQFGGGDEPPLLIRERLILFSNCSNNNLNISAKPFRRIVSPLNKFLYLGPMLGRFRLIELINYVYYALVARNASVEDSGEVIQFGAHRLRLIQHLFYRIY